jgi:hypothetical protein
VRPMRGMTTNVQSFSQGPAQRGLGGDQPGAVRFQAQPMDADPSTAPPANSK